jgi:hypothetical protein
MVALNFDATTVAESTSEFELLEPGEYRAEIVSAEPKESQTTMGNTYLALQVKTDSGRMLWDNRSLILWSEKESTVEKSRQVLATIAHAIGVTHIGDSDEMLLKPLMVRVEIEPGTNGYKDKNAITRYLPIGLSAPPAQQVAHDAQAPLPPTVGEVLQTSIPSAPWAPSATPPVRA